MPLRDGFLAIDIGTQSSRAAILTAEGETLTLVSRPHSMATPRPGWAEQNPEHWWEATVDNVRDVLSQLDGRVGIAAVAVCGQMHGTVPVARDGTALTPAVQLWCDKRAAGIAEEISAAHDPAALMGMAGNIPTAAWSGFKMAWMRRYQPEIYDQAWAILTPKDFVNLRLTGEIGTDRTEASGSFLMDVQSAEWSSTLIALLGLEAEKLPAIHASSDIIAGVSVEASRQTGLPSGTPVVAGSGDMLALLLGTGITAPGIACGILDSGGGSLRWWRDQFMSDGAGGGDAIYDQMMSEAAAVPAGCEGLLFLAYLLGEGTLRSAPSRGVFFGFHPRHGRAHATRAILEGICFDLRQSLEIAREAGIPVNEMRTGGGGARSEFWSGIKADVY